MAKAKKKPTKRVNKKTAKPDQVAQAPKEKPQCPRCGSRNTIAVSTRGVIQYRKCRVVICRWNFKAIVKK